MSRMLQALRQLEEARRKESTNSDAARQDASFAGEPSSAHAEESRGDVANKLTARENVKPPEPILPQADPHDLESEYFEPTFTSWDDVAECYQVEEAPTFTSFLEGSDAKRATGTSDEDDDPLQDESEYAIGVGELAAEECAPLPPTAAPDEIANIEVRTTESIESAIESTEELVEEEASYEAAEQVTEQTLSPVSEPASRHSDDWAEPENSAEDLTATGGVEDSHLSEPDDQTEGDLFDRFETSESTSMESSGKSGLTDLPNLADEDRAAARTPEADADEFVDEDFSQSDHDTEGDTQLSEGQQTFDSPDRESSVAEVATTNGEESQHEAAEWEVENEHTEPVFDNASPGESGHLGHNTDQTRDELEQASSASWESNAEHNPSDVDTDSVAELATDQEPHLDPASESDTPEATAPDNAGEENEEPVAPLSAVTSEVSHPDEHTGLESSLETELQPDSISETSAESETRDATTSLDDEWEIEPVDPNSSESVQEEYPTDEPTDVAAGAEDRLESVESVEEEAAGTTDVEPDVSPDLIPEPFASQPGDADEFSWDELFPGEANANTDTMPAPQTTTEEPTDSLGNVEVDTLVESAPADHEEVVERTSPADDVVDEHEETNDTSEKDTQSSSESQSATELDIPTPALSPAEVTALADLKRNESLKQYRDLAALLRSELAQGQHACAAFVSVEHQPHVTETLLRTAIAGCVDDDDGHVLVVDADFSDKNLTSGMDASAEFGLSEVLKSRVPWQQAVRATGTPGLCLLPAGRITPPKPEDGDVALANLLKELTCQWDLVLVDAGCCEDSTTSNVLSAARNVYLVVRLGETEHAAAQAAVEKIGSTGATLRGSVVTNA